MDLTFMFWNTNGKKCLEEINNLVVNYDVDILILAENTANAIELLSRLNSISSDFYSNHPNSKCNKIKIYSRFHYDFIYPIDESHRLTVRNVEPPILQNNLTLICLHFGDKGNFSVESQSEMTSELR